MHVHDECTFGGPGQHTWQAQYTVRCMADRKTIADEFIGQHAARILAFCSRLGGVYNGLLPEEGEEPNQP